MPGTANPFTLEKYKEESDYSYARIVLFLLPSARLKYSDVWKELIEDNETSATDDDQSSDSAELDQLPMIEIQPLSPLPSSLSAPLPSLLSSPFPSSLHSSLPGSSSGHSIPAQLVECPTCFQKFPAADVSSHADDCAESYWTRTDSPTDFCTSIKEGTTMKELYVPSLPKEIALLKETALRRTVNVTVRRKNIWNDFKRARERYYSPDQALKLTFSGEPAVDIGGPKREFFAGTYVLIHDYFNLRYYHQLSKQVTLANPCQSINITKENMISPYNSLSLSWSNWSMLSRYIDIIESWINLESLIGVLSVVAHPW